MPKWFEPWPGSPRFKWVPANLLLGVTLRWTSMPSRGEKCSYVDFCLIVTNTADPVSAISRLARTIERSLCIITGGIEAAVVSFDGTLVDI